LGQGSPKDLAKAHGSKRGKEEENGPRKPEEWNGPGKPEEWNGLAQQESGPIKTQKR